MRHDQYIDCPLRDLSGFAARSAAEYLHDALAATKHLAEDHEGIDRTAVVVAMIQAASAQEAAAMHLVGVQQTLDEAQSDRRNAEAPAANHAADSPVLYWCPGTAQVCVQPPADDGDRWHTGAGAYAAFREADFETRKSMLFIEAMHMIICDRCSPDAVHAALQAFPEYCDGLAADMPRNATL